MKRHLLALIVVVLLLVGAAFSWREAAVAHEEAARETRRQTLQEASDYWSGRYDTVAAQASAEEPATLRMAANAAFRKAGRDAGGTPPVDTLDQVLAAYASALRNGGYHPDAAFNFEYVARLRDGLARAPRRGTTAAPPAARSAPTPADDLPTGPTLHGRPGVHPPGTRGEEFEVLTPMDYGEREAQPEPTPGRRLPRKG